MIAALYVETNGVYFGLDGVDPWDQARDARSYDGPYPSVAHPPCSRWGRYWSGGPSSKIRLKLGDDDGCFAAALVSVRKYGGVLEHPEASHAWATFGICCPPWEGGWIQADSLGGYTCCVSQGHYGHESRKMTWLYVFGIDYRELPVLIWGPTFGMRRMEDSYHSAAHRREGMRNRSNNGAIENRLSHKARARTPLPFRDLLVSIARQCDPANAKAVQLGLFEEVAS